MDSFVLIDGVVAFIPPLVQCYIPISAYKLLSNRDINPYTVSFETVEKYIDNLELPHLIKCALKYHMFCFSPNKEDFVLDSKYDHFLNQVNQRFKNKKYHGQIIANILNFDGQLFAHKFDKDSNSFSHFKTFVIFDLYNKTYGFTVENYNHIDVKDIIKNRLAECLPFDKITIICVVTIPTMSAMCQNKYKDMLEGSPLNVEFCKQMLQSAYTNAAIYNTKALPYVETVSNNVNSLKKYKIYLFHQKTPDFGVYFSEQLHNMLFTCYIKASLDQFKTPTKFDLALTSKNSKFLENYFNHIKNKKSTNGSADTFWYFNLICDNVKRIHNSRKPKNQEKNKSEKFTMFNRSEKMDRSTNNTLFNITSHSVTLGSVNISNAYVGNTYNTPKQVSYDKQKIIDAVDTLATMQFVLRFKEGVAAKDLDKFIDDVLKECKQSVMNEMSVNYDKARAIIIKLISDHCDKKDNEQQVTRQEAEESESNKEQTDNDLTDNDTSSFLFPMDTDQH